jgi:hypothetical protein
VRGVPRVCDGRPRLVTVDLRLQVTRADDDRLSGTVTRAGTVRSFSGVLELMRVFEELVPSERPIDDEE